MQHSLYNEIKNIIKNDINYLKSYQIGSGKIEDIVSNLLTNKTNYETMNTNINSYIQKLTSLDKMINGDNTNIGMLKTAQKLQPTTGDTNIQNIFAPDNKFGEFIKKYKDFIETKLWNNERSALDPEIVKSDDPTKYDIFFDIDNTKPFLAQIDDFNEKLKILYNPYIVDKTKSLKENIIANIDKIDEIIKISKEFNNYIQGKKIEIDNILAINFKKENLKFVNALPEKETELLSFDNIKLNPDSALNINSIKQIESNISTIAKEVKISEELDKIKDVNIFAPELMSGKSLNDILNDILNVDNLITLKSATLKGGISGGAIDNKYFTFNSDLNTTELIKKIEFLFELLDNIFNNFEYMKELQYRYNFYLGYLFLIVRETAKNLTMETYQYISKQKIQLYNKIFQNIKKSFTTIKEEDKDIIFLNKYHYLTIYKLNELFKFILQNFQSDTDFVDVKSCTSNIYDDLILFNHFRHIIIKLCNTANGKNITQITDEEIKQL